MKKLSNAFSPFLALCVIVGIRAGYCGLFGCGTTPNLERSFYHYQPPINYTRPLSIHDARFGASPAKTPGPQSPIPHP